VDAFDGLVREALIVTAVLALPALVAGAAAGAVVAILQAATQVQEQTLTALPKLLVVGAVVAMGGRFGFGLCAQLLRDAMAHVVPLVRG
jgi:flagellar biosynthetic protein FliQ